MHCSELSREKRESVGCSRLTSQNGLEDRKQNNLKRQSQNVDFWVAEREGKLCILTRVSK